MVRPWILSPYRSPAQSDSGAVQHAFVTYDTDIEAMTYNRLGIINHAGSTIYHLVAS